ncbi:V-type proton ATPase 116 kDa subunit a 1-like [Dermatophagoides pteronyssinus]|uniref:V-type proton ATPase subunit a n=2 Tax=Dermatophagoides pteronyssinus TaxID=6956 RepID=A0A6P6XT93_DERPT|nr:V-type proton ATPase 116 kDa subunit a-like [Dermatophagoides pteronyssinus]KAH9425746.1 hypothetical protein DERP_004964 [Dermatophagoides pteronyssinus]
MNSTNRSSSKESKRQPCSGVFRSEEMLLCQLFLRSDVAFQATCRLGELGIVEFRDLNGDLNAYQRKYVDEIKHIGEIQRKLIYLYQQMLKSNFPIIEPTDDPAIPKLKEVIALENQIEKFESDLREINEHLYSLRIERSELVEMSMILAKTNQLLETTRRQRQSSFNGQYPMTDSNMMANQNQALDLEEPDNSFGIPKQSQQAYECNRIHTVTGLLRAEKALSFRKVIWRVCGQNALIQFFDVDDAIDDAKAEEFVQKKIFLIMCQGDKLFGKIKKICDGFHASQYPLPDDEDHYRRLCTKVEQNLTDIQLVIEETRLQYLAILTTLAKPQHFPTWKIQVTKFRAIFTTMNMFQKTEKGFLAEGWCARSDYHLLNGIVQEINDRAGILGQAVVEKVSTTSTPPTYFRLNRFTQGFQNIVDSYGIATYREMNPAPYTIITFPFLFAMMFADAGHGFLMMLFGLWMVLYERRLKGKSNNEIWLTFFDGRYIILLMGLFSIYTGSIYNDIFAKGYNLFGTSFIANPPAIQMLDNLIITNEDKNNNTVFDKNSQFYIPKGDRSYPYGIDPAWQISSNKILFLNSFKMKLSVIVGVTQMFFGVMISFCNHFNTKNWTSILFEFIPQIIFLLSLFGYMIALIFVKWIKIWSPPANAPSILIDFINMFLMKYPNEQAPETKYLNPWYPHKKEIQTTLLLLALIQVPIMLLIKPTIKVFFTNRRQRSPNIEESTASTSQQQDNGHHNEDENSTGDIYIYQAIHTIEYCLGSVSHTASYLRLWALSLAHSQLSEVLWTMVMHAGFANDNPNLIVRVIITYFSFGFWAVLTVVILVVMEGLSAFLHALRLHWVEFQSKFYTGNGYAFRPFYLQRILSETNILIE